MTRVFFDLTKRYFFYLTGQILKKLAFWGEIFLTRRWLTQPEQQKIYPT